MIRLKSRDGYIFLVTVLVIGVIASATAASLMLLGWAAEQNGLLLVQSTQAYEYAQTCAERTLRELRSDLGYAGNVTVTFERGSCQIHSIGGSANENRHICITGLSGDAVRRVQVDVAALFPSVRVRTWEEVSSFTLCQ